MATPAVSFTERHGATVPAALSGTALFLVTLLAQEYLFVIGNNHVNDARFAMKLKACQDALIKQRAGEPNQYGLNFEDCAPRLIAARHDHTVEHWLVALGLCFATLGVGLAVVAYRRVRRSRKETATTPSAADAALLPLLEKPARDDDAAKDVAVAKVRHYSYDVAKVMMMYFVVFCHGALFPWCFNFGPPPSFFTLGNILEATVIPAFVFASGALNPTTMDDKRWRNFWLYIVAPLFALQLFYIGVFTLTNALAGGNGVTTASRPERERARGRERAPAVTHQTRSLARARVRRTSSRRS